MNSVRQSCRPKHQVLILKCYPRFQKGVQSVTPNSSELSYLLYYASTRRSKLQKVGAFLEKRAARDVWRAKIGNVQVTLQILTALIEKLPRDLPLYARSILTILDTVLNSHEISMVEESIPTFEVFCSHQDTATLAADQEYINQYRDVVRKYASFANPDSSSVSKTSMTPQMVLRWRNAGLQAIKSVVSSEALGTDGARQLNIVIPVILQNLYASGDPGLSPLQEKAENSERQEREQARRRRMSIATVQTVDTVDANPVSASGSTADADKAAEIEVRVLALRCLERSFTTGSNRVQIRLATSLVLNFIVSRRPVRHTSTKEASGHDGSNGNWATNLLEVIANWAPVQDRFIILVTLMETLVDRPLVDGQLGPQITLASMMEWLLSSPINLIGLSVMDVLIALLRYDLLLLHLGGRTSKLVPPQRLVAFTHPLPPVTETVANSKPASRDGKQQSSESVNSVAVSSMRQELLGLLQNCIANLATHIYYGDQVSDMIKTIVSRLKPSTPTTTANGGPPETDNPNTKPEQPQEDPSLDTFFSFPGARVTALKAIQDILVVANLQNSKAGAGPDPRNRVPIQVWEGTQWLLRDPERSVRQAYVDAFISWLQLETSENDLKIPIEPLKVPKIGAKRDASPEKLSRRVVSANAANDKATSACNSRFLQLLHFVVYENATEASATESDILLLHVLLFNLVDNIGINAIRYGLPMIMSLQSYYLDSTPSSSRAILQIASLVHGYLCAVTEKFELEGTKVGNEIVNEIARRQNKDIWLDKVQLPPRPVSYIASTLDSKVDEKTLSQPNTDAYTPFMSLNELVAQIETAYNTSFMSPPASPANPPGRAFSLAPTTQGNTQAANQAKVPVGSRLPQFIKDQMLSAWSRDACLAAMESEKGKSSSLSGSKAGTGVSAARNQFVANIYKNGNDSPTDSHFGNRRYQHSERAVSTAPGPTSGLGEGQKGRRQSVTDVSHSPATGSSRDSTVRVNELRRVLSVINNTSVRYPSPLRGRPRLGSDASSTESMATDNFSNSDVGGTTAAGAVLERVQTMQTEQETPRASSTRLNGTRAYDGQLDTENHMESDDIPPVPPLPSSLAIPGGFPADSVSGSAASTPSHSPVRVERPATAPSARISRTPLKEQKGNAIPTVRQSRSLTRQKSRPGNRKASTGPVTAASPPSSSQSHARNHSDGAVEPNSVSFDDSKEKLNGKPLGDASRARSWTKTSASRTRSLSRRVDVDRLLDGLAIRDEDTTAIASTNTAEIGRTTGHPPRIPSFSTPFIAPNSTRTGKKQYKFTDGGEEKLNALGKNKQARDFTSRRGGIGRPPY